MPRSKQRTGVGRRGRPTMLSSTPTAELRRELERRQAMLHDIMRQRDQLNSELEDLQALFGGGGSLGTAPVHRGPGRPPGSGKRGPGRPPMSGKRGPGRPPGTGRRGRPPGSAVGGNKTNLVGALQSALRNRTMSVAEVSDAVQAQGYKTTSTNFRVIVNQALLANPDKFKKVARGQYTAK